MNETQLTATHFELIDLLKSTPLQLWNKYNADLVSADKIIVPSEKAFTNPQETIDGLAKFCSLKWKDSKRVEYIKAQIIAELRKHMTAEEQEVHGFKIEYKKKSEMVSETNN